MICINLLKNVFQKMFFEYADTGSWTSSTYKRNENDFKSISGNGSQKICLIEISVKSLLVMK